MNPGMDHFARLPARAFPLMYLSFFFFLEADSESPGARLFLDVKGTHGELKAGQTLQSQVAC